MPFTEIKTNLIANSAVTQAKIDPAVELGGGAAVTSASTAPSSPEAGDLWHNTTNNKIFVYYNTSWVEVESGSLVATTNTFTSDGSQLNYTLSPTPANEDHTLVIIGGVPQNKSTYSLSGSTLTLTEAPNNGITVEVVIFTAGGGSGGGSGASTALSNLANVAINTSLLPATTLTIDLGSSTKRWRDLYLSGNTISLGDATISATGSTIALPAGTTVGGTAIGAGASVTTSATAPSTPSTGDLWYKTTDSSLNVYENSVWNRVGGSTTTRTVETFTATAGQTTFTPSTNYSYVDVYKNNVRVPTNQYTATNGVNVVLTTGATAGDVIEIYAYATIGGTAQGTGGLSIVSVVVTDVSGTPLGYAGFAEVGGGYVKITGTGFSSGISATIGGTAALSTVYNSSTEVIVRVPPKSYGSYGITLTDLLGFTVSLTNAVIYYPAATWVTSASLPDIAMDIPVSIQLQAVGGTAFALASGSALPAGLTLNTVNGLISGTLTVFSGDSFSTSFVVNVTNNVGVSTSRTFTLFANAARYQTESIQSSTAINRYWIFENVGTAHKFAPPHFGNYDMLLVGGGGGGGRNGGGGGAGGVAEKLNVILNSTSSVYYQKISAIRITNRGTGYSSAPTVVITPAAGNTPTVTATATATISGGVVTSISITNNGNGYTSAPTITFTGGSGTGAAAVSYIGGNEIFGINVGAGGIGSSNTTTATAGGNTSITKNALPVDWIGYGGGEGGAGGAASSGGSGGGAGGGWGGAGSATQPGSATGGYGNSGAGLANELDGGGGGGAGGAGTLINATGNTSGGPGRLMTGWEIRGTNASNTLTGTRGYYGGGGSGGWNINTVSGGGGGISSAGLDGTGGGGSAKAGAFNGGSGILIIKQKYGYDADILLAAGGGSSGSGSGFPVGAGGAGGMVYTSGNQFNVLPGELYTVTVGAADTNSSLVHANYTITAIAGGSGGNSSGNSANVGNPGGSGGGGAGYDGGGFTRDGGATTQLSTTGYGQGNRAGNGSGGGAGGPNPTALVGGPGIQWVNGTTYCRGGNLGGGTSYGANSGGGGHAGNAGNSGIFIIRYAGPQRGSGGTITSVDGYTYHTFTTSGVFTG
jgi:hypothetical protein